MSRHPFVRSPIYPDKWTAVYRLFDAASQLLYVGVGYSYLARWKAHAKKREWWASVVTKDVIWYDNRLDAMIEEARAIRDEAPLHNDEEGISLFGFATFRTKQGPVVNPEMEFTRDRLSPPRFDELLVGGKHTLVAHEGQAVAVIVDMTWYRRACAADNDPIEF